MPSKNLWGELPDIADVGRSPRDILKEQAEALTAATRRGLVGEVRTEAPYKDIEHELVIITPYLNNYEVTICRASHGAETYPVQVFDMVGSVAVPPCDREETFEKALQSILTSEKVRRIIASLLSQSGSKGIVPPPFLQRQQAE